MSKRIPNSYECNYFGRKLSNIICDVEVSKVLGEGYVCIGSDRDDEITWGECLAEGEKILKERVTITVFHKKPSGDEDVVCDIDLEDVLRFGAENCPELCDRVMRDALIANEEPGGGDDE